MSRKQIKDSALSNIESQERLAKEGKDFSATTIIESKRLLELADTPFTEEEERRMMAAYESVPFDTWQNVKDIKDKYSLSWNELKTLAQAMPFTVADDIKGVIRITKLTQAKFGEKYGIPTRTIENWVSGQRECPSYVFSLLKRVAIEDYS